MDTPAADPTPARRARLPLVDILRGAALVAMIVYHFSWDLAYHRLVDWDVTGDPAWRGFAIAIAASFLALSGIGLVLAARGGLDGRAFLLRLLKIGGAAAVITLGTVYLFPDTFIFFGILHLIALGSVLALPFLRAPAPVSAAAALTVFALPLAISPGIFEAPWLAFTGLSTVVPPSNDFVPVFPWFAAMLAGVAIGRWIEAGRIRLAPGPPGTAWRWLATLGRWSLPVYLLHQPLLFGAVALAAHWLPADPVAERARFVSDCIAGCGNGGEACRSFCGCVAGAMDGTTFWSVRGGDQSLAPLVPTAAMACRAGDTPPE